MDVGKMDSRCVAVFIIIFFLIFLFSTLPSAKGSDEYVEIHELVIDGDATANGEWHAWSYYLTSSPEYDHPIYYQTNGIIFTSYMYKKVDGGWAHLAREHTTIIIKNVMHTKIRVSMFSNSTIIIENCWHVVLGTDLWAYIPALTSSNISEQVSFIKIIHREGFLQNTLIVAKNVGILEIGNYSYTLMDGTPITVERAKYVNITKNSRYFRIYASVLVNSPGMVIRNVGNLTFASTDMKINAHTPGLLLENIWKVHVNKNLEINNEHYVIENGTREERGGGIGILTQHVRSVGSDTGAYKITISHCEVGIAFENNGTGEAFNNSAVVVFSDVDKNYVAHYGEPQHHFVFISFKTLIPGLQAITGTLVAIAWLRVGALYFSESSDKKVLAKEMMKKASIGTLILVLIVYGYPVMEALLKWVFGG